MAKKDKGPTPGETIYNMMDAARTLLRLRDLHNVWRKMQLEMFQEIRGYGKDPDSALVEKVRVILEKWTREEPEKPVKKGKAKEVA